MKLYQKILVLSWVIGSIVLCMSLFAQEELTPMYLDDKGGELEGETIYTGKVIAYGELLEPPYIVKFERDTMWINGISVEPRIKTFVEEPQVFVISAYDSMKFVRDTSIVHDFKQFIPLYGDSKTMELLREKYLPDTIVSDIDYDLEGQYVSTVRITYTDGTKCNYTGFGDRDKDGNFVFHHRGHFTEEESIRSRNRYFRGIKDDIRQDYLIIFGYTGKTFVPPGDEQTLILETLYRIAKGEISIEEVKAEYPNKAPFRHKYFWKEFELKKDSWI